MSYVQDEFQAFIEDPAAGCELKPALTTNYSKAATAITYLCPDIRDGRGEGLEIVRSRLLVFLFLFVPFLRFFDVRSHFIHEQSVCVCWFSGDGPVGAGAVSAWVPADSGRQPD